MRKKRLYYYRTLLSQCIFGASCGSVSIFCLLCGIASKDKYTLIFTIIVAIFMIIPFVYQIYRGYLTPILVDSSGIKYRKIEYSWSEIKVTIQYFGRLVYLIISDHYMRDEKDVKNALRNGCRMYFDRRSLQTILEYCQSKILVSDHYYNEIEMERITFFSKEANRALYEFNKRFEEDKQKEIEQEIKI